MQETETTAMDMLFYALRKWRKIIVFAIVCALLAGAITAVIRTVQINDEKKIERWQTEYEVAYGAYWAAINDIDRLISENERLASQATIEIEKLEIKKKDYEGRLEDMAAKIIYYEALIEDYVANIEKLELEREKLEYYLTHRKEQNENSLLMKIDPYNVNVYNVYIRIDSGYEILPGNTYQNVDPTPEILQTYRLLVNNSSFLGKMISDLNLDTEVRYLAEVISVNEYNMNSLRIKISSATMNWARQVGEYIAAAILAEHENVALSIAEHELIKYNTTEYTVVDLATYAQQYEFIQEAIDYEESIRDVGVAILNIEASIRDMNTAIRESKQQIDDINLAINELPLKAQTLENEINGYRDANFVLRSEQLGLLSKPEPTYTGFTPFSVFTGFVKFAIIGGVISAVLAAIYFVLAGILRGKAFSSAQICDAVDSEFFGFWPKTANKRLAFIDRFVEQLTGDTAKGMTPDVSKELVLSNVAVACEGKSKIILCGGANKQSIAMIADAVKAQLPSVEVLHGGTIEYDPAAVRGVAECDAVILVEQLTESSVSAAVQLKERAELMGKPVLGVIALG